MGHEFKIEFLINKKEKLDPICRVCLSENIENARSVYEDCESGSIASVVMLCARVQIVCQDGLPDIICARCLGDLEATNSFRVRCELSDSLLRQVYTDADQSMVQEKGITTETEGVVKEEVSHDFSIKCEFEDGSDSDLGSDPLFQNVPTNVSLKNNQLTNRLFEESVNTSKHKKRIGNSNGILNSILNSKTVSDCFKESIFSQSTRANGLKTKSFVCKICHKPLSTKKSLERHNKVHSKDKKLLYGHITGYGKNRRFNCFECPYSSHRQQALVYHSRTHTGDKPYVCEICQSRFAQPGSLNSHKKMHSDKMYFTCPECGRQFKEKNVFDRHKRVHDPSKNFICNLCAKGLKSKDTLASHMKRHFNIRNYSCEHCGRTFISPVELSYHIKKHTDPKKFECDMCGLKTRLKQSLVAHVKRHSAVRQFKCDHCEYTAFDVYALKKHQPTHTGAKNYSCPICEVKFMHSTSVNSHMKRVHKVDYKINDHTDRRVIK